MLKKVTPQEETREEMQARHEREWKELQWENSIPWLILLGFLLALLIGGVLGAILTIH